MAGFGSSIKLSGESEYQRALKQINQSLREVSSEMKVVSSSFDKNDKSTQAMTQRSEVLNKKLEEQKNKLSVLTQKYNEMNNTYGKNSTAQKQLTEELTKERAELERIGNTLGKTSKEYQDQQKVVDELENKQVQYNNAISKAKTEMNQAQAEINKTTKELDDLGKETQDTTNEVKKAGDGFTVFKGVLSNLATQGINAAINGFKKLGNAVVSISKQAIGSYAEYEQLVGGVETLFKDSAKVVQDYASQAYKTAGISANQYMSQATSFSASLLQGLGGDTKKAAEIANMAIIDMSDNANKMGTSMEMIQNAYQGFAKQNYTMLDNLKLGYGGTKSEMARLVKESGILGKAGEDLTAKNLDQKVSFDQIIKAINQVQQNMGITGTTSREASSTIEGSVKSMKAAWGNLLTAIADDNKDMKKSVNEFVNSTITAAKNLVPRIKTSVDGIKKLINSIVTEVFPKLKKEIPQLKPLITTFEWFIKNKSLVVNAMKVMVAAFAVTKINAFTKSLTDSVKGVMALTVATQTNTAAQVVGTTTTGALTTATNLLNAAWKANPIGLVITGVTALIGVFSLFKGKTEEVTEAQRLEQEQLNKTRDALNSYENAMEEADNTRQEYLDSNMSEISYYQDLANELKNITDENGKVQEGYEARAKFIATTLNEALGTEIKLTDNVIKDYKGLEEAINNVIEAKRAQILVEANEGKYNTAKDQKVKLEEAYSLAIQDANAKEKTRDGILKQIADRYGTTAEVMKKFIDENGRIDVNKFREYALSVDLADESVLRFGYKFQALDDELAKANESLNESSQVLASAREEYSKNQLTISNYETALINLKDKNYEAVLGIYEDTHEFIGKTDKETYNNYQKQINMQKDYLAELKTNKQGYDKEYIEKETKKTNDVIKNLEEEQAKYKQVTDKGLKETNIVWSDNLDDQLSIITGSKIEFKNAANGLVQMYIDGVKQGKPKSKEEMAKLTTESIKEITSKKPEAKEAGENLIDGVNKGISNQNKQSGVFSAISNFGNKLLTKLKNSLQEKSPSKATKEMGQYLLEGLGIGIENEEKNVLKQVSNVGKDILSSLQGELSQNLSLGNIQTGLNLNENSLGNINTLNDFNSVVEAFKTALSDMKIEMNDEEMGKFVDKTVANAIYN